MEVFQCGIEERGSSREIGFSRLLDGFVTISTEGWKALRAAVVLSSLWGLFWQLLEAAQPPSGGSLGLWVLFL